MSKCRYTWKRTRIYEHEELGIFIEGESNTLLDGYYAKGYRYKLMEADLDLRKAVKKYIKDVKKQHDLLFPNNNSFSRK